MVFLRLKWCVVVGVAAMTIFAAPMPAMAQNFNCSLCDVRDNAMFKASDCESGSALYNYCTKGLLPFCARTRLGCNSLADVAFTLITYGRFLFGIAGSVALLFVIYGGFKMIFSLGNGEKYESGKGALTAAVMGLVIIFSAYLVVGIIIRALNIEVIPEINQVVPF